MMRDSLRNLGFEPDKVKDGQDKKLQYHEDESQT